MMRLLEKDWGRLIHNALEECPKYTYVDKREPPKCVRSPLCNKKVKYIETIAKKEF